MDNFLHEIADTRGELFNVDIKDKKLKTKFKGVMENLGITPTGKEYEKAINLLIKDIIIKMKHSRKLSKITQALRLVYYKRAAKVMKKGKRIVPCYAGISNAHLNPWGGLWICNVQAFNKEMGNIKNFNYNFNKLWHSKQAYDIRRWVKSNKCHCPLVGQAFLDTIMNPKELIKVFWYYLRY